MRELPYSVADVQLLVDCEELEALSQVATAAVMQVRRVSLKRIAGFRSSTFP